MDCASVVVSVDCAGFAVSVGCVCVCVCAAGALVAGFGASPWASVACLCTGFAG